jgi:hypothetical protein
MHPKIHELHQKLSCHPLYQEIKITQDLQVFMQSHVYAVWDFMSLLKSLQNKVTSVQVPWSPSGYPDEMVRLINEIVLGEESDVDPSGKAISHFALYLEAMKEVGAPVSEITDFTHHLKFNTLPSSVREFVLFNINLALEGQAYEVAAAFFYGREKLIPDMFTSIKNLIKKSELNCPKLIYYFERHIEVDGEEHGPKALQCLDYLLDTETKKQRAIEIAIASLELRHKLWDNVMRDIYSSRSNNLFDKSSL